MKEQGPSTVHLPIKLAKENIETTINQLITGVVYEDTDIGDDGLLLRARKSQDIKIEFEENAVRYRIVLDIWLKKDLKVTNAEVNGEIAIEMITSYFIQEDWTLRTETEVMTHDWIKKPTMKLGLLDLSIKFVVNKIIKRSKETLGQTLDQQLAQRFNLRHYIQNAWDLLQNPIQLVQAHRLYLQLKPEALSMTPLMIKDSEISSKILVHAKTNAVLGEKPSSKNVSTLPPFQYTEIKEDVFQIQLGARMSYEEIVLLAKKYLLGKAFSFEIGSITPEDIILKWQGEKLLVDVELSGSYHGRVEIKARPIFDEAQKTIKFENLELNLNTTNILYRSIGWLFRNALERRITEALNFPLQKRLHLVKELIQQKLKKHSINENILLSGHLEDLEIQKMNFNQENIDILLRSHGNVELEVKGWDIKAKPLLSKS